MSSKISAFKTQNKKNYGNVEKMYIHFYTISESADTLKLYWYCNDSENKELFLDFKHYLQTMKGYDVYKTYTGDILYVTSLHKFKEALILLGTEDVAASSWALQNGELTVNSCKVSNLTRFYDLYDICFDKFDFVSTFSTDPNHLKNNHLKNKDEAYFASNMLVNDNKLILVDFNGRNDVMPHFKFNQLHYTTINSKLDTETLYNWFNVLIKNKEYTTVYNTIHNLISFNDANTETLNEEEAVEADGDDEVVDETVEQVQEPAKISHDDWVKLFCDLYLNKEVGSDILLSDVYDSYVTASKWTNTVTLTMAQFIKKLRAMNIFTIKRRSKGMMIIGYSCLVGKQSEFFQQVKDGQCFNRNLLKFLSPYEINSLICGWKSTINKIDHKYARETILLFKSRITYIGHKFIPSYQLIAQFVSIPQMESQLKIYADYIDSILKSNEICTATPGQAELEAFRVLSEKCTIYDPFVLTENTQSPLLNNSSGMLHNNDITHLLKYKDTMPGLLKTDSLNTTPFNEHFGMFKTSKHYHHIEDHNPISQDYNNMRGSPLP